VEWPGGEVNPPSAKWESLQGGGREYLGTFLPPFCARFLAHFRPTTTSGYPSIHPAPITYDWGGEAGDKFLLRRVWEGLSHVRRSRSRSLQKKSEKVAKRL
jgi:hypothetical protein